MDSFTQRILEKAEQRSRALGISNSAIESGANSLTSTNTPNTSKLHVVEKTVQPLTTDNRSPEKVLRQFSAIDKENIEMGIEINIMTDKNIEVQVQVEEQDLVENEIYNSNSIKNQQPINQPLAKLRDTSRTRLQRLGALYSNSDDLSSPIHRTEGNFHAGDDENDFAKLSSTKQPKRYGKLVALANSISQWEDDSLEHQAQYPNAKQATEVQNNITTKDHTISQYNGKRANPTEMTKYYQEQNKDVTKITTQLKWDPKVIDSLEAQGFQRRESSVTKISYEYPKSEETEVHRLKPTQNSITFLDKKCNILQDKALSEIKNPKQIKSNVVKTGFVSDKAAVFENKAEGNMAISQRLQKDPTELSLKERMRLFERNKGEAPMPKAAFGMAPSINQIRQDKAVAIAKKEIEKVQQSYKPHASSTSKPPYTDAKVREKVAHFISNSSTLSESKIIADIQREREKDMEVLANRFLKQKESTLITQELRITKQNFPNFKETSTNNVANIVRPPTPPPPPPIENIFNAKRRSSADSIDESKRARTSITNTTKGLYPKLSDLEQSSSQSGNDKCCSATASARSTPEDFQPDPDYHEESFMEESDADEDNNRVNDFKSRLGVDVMQVVHKNECQPAPTRSTKKVIRYAEKNDYYGCDSSMNSSEDSIGVDDYLDEALEDRDSVDDYTRESADESEVKDFIPTSNDSKGTTASTSFCFRKPPSSYRKFETISEGITADNTHLQPITSELSVNKESENMVTLVHTVSFYRRQQTANNSANSTPVRKICRDQNLIYGEEDCSAKATLNFESTPQKANESYKSEDEEISESVEFDDSKQVQEKITKLLDEVCKQQQIIAQTSQALNLCAATIEFSGSTESVEGERHLLVATHRRQACLDEVQRIRIEKRLRSVGAPKEKGRLTIQGITVPLRKDYIRKLAADTISGHHLVCLLKYNEHVLATKSVPTLPGLLAVKFPDVLQLNNVYADFRITIEIYGMTAQREVLPHEVKYHINLNKKCGIKTPKKKGSDNRLVMPPVQSLAGPHVVRSPALVQYGFAIFSLREIQRTTWTLTQILGVSPLDGIVHMKVNCELSVSVEYKGFLTMFEDISGFGAWHRRWCHLNGTVLNYWKYPDDEKKKTPMGSIELYTCSSQKVTTAPRDICARLNTILLECERPAKDTDTESLIIVPNGHITIIRHLLSADTKQEREEWCAYFNKALTLLRAWGPPQ